jgi:hypothetical protein
MYRSLFAWKYHGKKAMLVKHPVCTVVGCLSYAGRDDEEPDTAVTFTKANNMNLNKILKTE